MFAKILGVMASVLSAFREPEITGDLYLPSKVDRRGNTIEYLHNKGIAIKRSKNGVPHIEAKSEYDGIYAQGFLQAQERLFQLELLRRIAKGTLSEIIPEAEEVDKISRTYGFYRLGLEDIEIASASELALASVDHLQAFVEGINGFLSECYTYSKPVEMTLYSMEKPSFFQVEDITAIARLIAYQNSRTWVTKLIHAIAEHTIKLTKMNVLDKESEDNHKDESEKKNYKNPFLNNEQSLRLFFQLNWEKISNWMTQTPCIDNSSSCIIIPGKLTKNGKPIFALDIHDDLTAPSRYMQLSVSVNDEITKVKYHVVGIAIVGMPYLVAGVNDHVAFGPIRSNRDSSDLFIETIDTSDNSRYEYKKRWYYSATIDEQIKVKGQKDLVSERVRITNHGPILPGFLKKQNLARNVTEIALSATYLKSLPRDLRTLPTESFYLLNRAQNVDDVHIAISDMSLFPFVYSYAHVDGSFGRIEASRLPSRKTEQCQNPVDGSSGEHDWDRQYVKNDDLPTKYYDAESNVVYIHSANTWIPCTRFVGFPLSYNRRGTDLQRFIKDFIANRTDISIDEVIAFQCKTEKTLLDRDTLSMINPLTSHFENITESIFATWREHADHHEIPYALVKEVCRIIRESAEEPELSLESDSSCVLFCWFSELIDMIMSRLLTRSDTTSYGENMENDSDNDDDEEASIEFGLFFKNLGIVDYMLHLPSGPRRFLAILLESYSLELADIMESLVRVISLLRDKDHSLKKMQPTQEVQHYTMKLLRSPVHISHFIEHQKVSGFEIQKSNSSLGTYSFDTGRLDHLTSSQIEPIQQDLTKKHNYLNFSPNLPGQYRHSSFRLVCDLSNPKSALSLFVPGNSGHRHSKWYRHSFDHYLSQTYTPIFDPSENLPTLTLHNIQTRSILNTSMAPHHNPNDVDEDDDEYNLLEEQAGTLPQLQKEGTSVEMDEMKQDDRELV